MIDLIMQPGFKPPLCAEIDRLKDENGKLRLTLSDVQQMIMVILGESDDVPPELLEIEERLSRSSDAQPR